MTEREGSHSERAFFGRRKGHPLRSTQARLFDVLLPKLALELSAPAPFDLRTLFHTPVQDVRLEIGFGGGEHLISQAESHPASGFIGCEPFLNGMAKALAAITARDLKNIRLHFGDAADLLGWLPAGMLTRIDLLYADPWPKRRHWKRRFVQESRMAELARVVAPGGEFRFVTDWSDYADWTLALFLQGDAFEWTAERADDWRCPWPGYVSTRYEAKAMRGSRAPCYLRFRRI